MIKYSTRPHPECCIYRTARVYGAFTDLLVYACVGGLLVLSSAIRCE